MFQLPDVSLPVLDGLLSLLPDSSTEQMLRAIAEPTMQCLDALDYVMSCDIAGVQQECSEKTMFAGTKRDDAPKNFSERFCGVWSESEADKYISRELQQKLVAVSYSAFSWPYPVRSELSGEERKYYSLPKGYTLCIPFSSRMIVSLKDEPSFFGYIALLFDDFPALKDDRVQLIISLPLMVSEAVSAFCRNRISRDSSCFADLVHEIKRYLLMTVDLTANAASDRFATVISGLNSQAKRLLLVTNTRLLVERDTARRLKVSPMKLDVNDLIEETCEEFDDLFVSSNCHLRRQYCGEMPEIFLDPALFPSVISNLLDNALKYSQSGGEVLVRTDIVSKSVVIEVLDKGIGVVPSEREEIFKRFHRGSNASGHPGDGLGLYLVRRIVELHGGNARCELSNSGETVFRIELPL
jgi:signal transduction histidine kinase